MKILFAAPENAFGGFLGMIRSELPEHDFVATGRFGLDSLEGFDVLIKLIQRQRYSSLDMTFFIVGL